MDGWESSKSHEQLSKLLAEELMGRAAVIANEAWPGGNVISVLQEQSALQKLNEA